MELPWKEVWDVWDLRAFIIISLSLQTFLTFFAPLRKRMSSNWITIPLWSAYLLADWVANVAIGLISNSNNISNSGAVKKGDLEAFWATFFLVHLGGPDTITAFALEDNELWIRHFLALIVQCLAALYLFFQTLPGNKLWIPTVLVFVAGIIKYSERTRSLYLASLANLRHDMLRDNGLEALKYHIFTMENSNTTGMADGVLTELAYYFFNILKGLIVTSILRFSLPNQSRDFFLKGSAEEAFRVIELELNLMYEFLYNKVSVVHCKLGYICRFVSFSLVVAALGLFHLAEKKQERFNGFDVGITYVLLLGAIVLDIIAFLMLLFSTWTIISLFMSTDDSDHKSLNTKIVNFLLAVKRGRRIADSAKLRKFLQRGWSESVSQYNLIDRLKYVKRVSFTTELRDFIFNELLIKASRWKDVAKAKQIYSARGEAVLREKGHHNLLPSVEVEYDRSLLLWHIATELCYSSDGDSNAAAVLQIPTMSAVAGDDAYLRFIETCDRIQTFCWAHVETPARPNIFAGKSEQIRACKTILSVDTEHHVDAINGSKSVFYDACRLANELQKLEEEDKWETMSRVWVELLSYAASRCEAYTHAQQLNKGGDLITLVWLLMLHLGLCGQSQESRKYERLTFNPGEQVNATTQDHISP